MSPPPRWKKLYPFDSHWLSLPEGKYHYLDEGKGTPLLLVHGNPTWSFFWRNIILGLRDKARLVAPDHLGCGLSDKPQDYPYRLKNHIDNLCALIENLDLKNITLVAHDWGGAIGLGAAETMPDRFSKIVLSNTAAFLGGRIPWRIRICRTPFLGTLAVQGFNAFARAACRMAIQNRNLFSPEAAEGMIAPYDSWANRVATLRFVEDIPLSPTHPSRARFEQLEAELKVLSNKPMMLIWGMKDWCFTPWFLHRFQEIFPHAETHELADVGHYVMEEAPQKVVELVREFIQRPAQNT